MSATLNTIRRNSGNRAAIVFIHGFGGDSTGAWGNFPHLLASDPRLDGWDVYSLGYETNLRVDVLVKLWSADPDLDKVALRLRTEARDGDLARYGALCLIAHSMGGLVTQRALIDDNDMQQRATHVVLFGTPSGGLLKASLARMLKPQLRNMAKDGAFIRRLRDDWTTSFVNGKRAKLPFRFLVVAGESDEFVPADSSLGPFPESVYGPIRCVVPGNHIQLVKPTDA